MALTPEQSAAVGRILAEYRKELASILDAHKQAVSEAVARMDAEKTEKIRRMIGG
jgi:hypothetical protein